METNQEVIIPVERAIDHNKLRAVLLEWGYQESEIQRFDNLRKDQTFDAQSERTKPNRTW